jgi:hypothetical protein
MKTLFLLLVAALASATLCAVSGKAAPEAVATLPPAADHQVDFHREILPILANRCATCHAMGRNKGGFSLETRTSLLAESDSGKAVVPGKSGESLLIQLVAGIDPDQVMPKQGKRLTAAEVGLLRAWIDQGAVWDADVSLRKLTMQSWLPRTVKVPDASPGLTHPIDRILGPYYREHQVDAAAVVDDQTFARRVYYDLGGLPPTPAEMQAFLSAKEPDKRARLVRKLLDDRDRYAQHWLTFWNDLLRNDYAGTGYIDGGRQQITSWLYTSLHDNKPLDRFVRELIEPAPGAEGFVKGIVWRGAVNASQRPPLQAAQNISQIFLGVNLKCASCHDSFVSPWKLDDAYALASVFSDQPLELFRCDKATGKFASARSINPELGVLSTGANRQQRQSELAKLLTSPQNARLRRTIVNRVWARFFGRGLIEPVDELDNPAWSEDVLEWLTVDLQAHGDDLQRTMEQIAASRAYQLKSTDAAPEESERYVFRGPLVKRLTAEQFVDTIWLATGSAPAKADANIRMQGKSSASPPWGKWVWSDADASTAKPAAGEQITLRQSFTLDAAVKSASAVVTCDNEYKLWVNGRKLGGDADWTSVERIDLAPALRGGKNEVVILARNLGKSPNPAGLFFAATVTLDSGKTVQIATDDTWRWTAAAPNEQGVLPATEITWKPAAVLANQAFLGAEVNQRIAQMMTGGGDRKPSSVRAALVVADPLMRSLGRPNREQVVTTRPDVLTTLEALDLTNGQALSSLLDRGAANLIAAHPAWKTDDAIAFAYQNLLCRPATPAEQQVARQIVGDKLTASAVSDLLWTVLMLPDFQLIR